MDRGPTGLEVTRRHLPRLVGGLAVLVGFRSALSQPMAQPMERKTTMKIDRNGSRPSTKGRRIILAARSALNLSFKSVNRCA